MTKNKLIKYILKEMLWNKPQIDDFTNEIDKNYWKKYDGVLFKLEYWCLPCKSVLNELKLVLNKTPYEYIIKRGEYKKMDDDAHNYLIQLRLK